MRSRIIPAAMLIKRKSLAEQIADQLRDSLQKGTWTGFLPPERSLCRMADVSRPTLREALHILHAEGWIEIEHGRPPRILERRSHRRLLNKPERVAMLWAMPFQAMSPLSHVMIDEIRSALAQQGQRLDLVVDLRLHRKQPTAILEQLVRQYGSAHWILASLPRAVQEWFQQQPLHVVVSGHVFPGVELPSVDVDFRSVSRHAAGMLLGLGHQRIIFLVRSPGAAGDAAAEAGLSEAFRSHPQAVCYTIRHQGEVDQIRSQLKTVLACVPRPTAILVSQGMDALVAMNLFLESGIRIPRELSVISLQTESFLERMRPKPARYEMDVRRHALAICHLINRPSRRLKTFRLTPRFVRGETLCAPSA